MADGCLACDLAAGRRPLPGGRIFRTEFWLVGDFPDEAEVARLAERARELFALGPPPDGLS